MKPLSQITDEHIKILAEELDAKLVDQTERSGTGVGFRLCAYNGEAWAILIRDARTIMIKGHDFYDLPIIHLRLLASLGYDVLGQHDLFEDIAQCLRECDADLDSVQQRYEVDKWPDSEDLEAARESRRHIASVYKKLPGKPWSLI